MCKPASFIITKDRVFWSKFTDSHENIIEEHGLHADGAKGPNIVRVEIVPPGDDMTRPAAAWVFNVDQDVLPKWWDHQDGEKRARVALDDWIAANVIREDRSEPVTDGRVFICGSATVGEVCGSATVKYVGDSATVQSVGDSATVQRVGGSATVEYVGGSATVQSVGDSATVQRVCGSATVQSVGGSATVEYVFDSATVQSVGGSATVQRVCGSATVEYVGGSATVQSVGDSATVEYVGGSATVQRVGGSATVNATGRATVIRYSKKAAVTLADQAVMVDRSGDKPVCYVAGDEF